MDESEKRQIREQMSSRYQASIDSVRQHWTLTTPPYLDGPYSDGMRFLKAWQLWEPSDLRRLDHRLMQVMDDMATCDDFAHLSQILPNYYRTHGGVRAFARDIEVAAVARGDVIHRTSYTPDVQPQQAPATTQASLSGLDQLVRNAGQLANVTLHPASDILPATVRAAASLVRAA